MIYLHIYKCNIKYRGGAYIHMYIQIHIHINKLIFGKSSVHYLSFHYSLLQKSLYSTPQKPLQRERRRKEFVSFGKPHWDCMGNQYFPKEKKKPKELKNKIAFEMKKIALTKNTAQQNNSHHYQERNCLTKWNLSRCSTFPLYQLKSIPTSSTSKDSTNSSLQI